MPLSYKDIQLALRAALVAVVGLPPAAQRAWENVAFKPTIGTPHILEQFAPSSAELQTNAPEIAPNVRCGEMESRGLYIIQLFAPTGTGIGTLRDGTDAILAAFPAARTIATTGGRTISVRGDAAPYPSDIKQLDGGAWSYVSVTIAWQVYYSLAA